MTNSYLCVCVCVCVCVCSLIKYCVISQFIAHSMVMLNSPLPTSPCDTTDPFMCISGLVSTVDVM